MDGDAKPEQTSPVSGSMSVFDRQSPLQKEIDENSAQNGLEPDAQFSGDSRLEKNRLAPGQDRGMDEKTMHGSLSQLLTPIHTPTESRDPSPLEDMSDLTDTDTQPTITTGHCVATSKTEDAAAAAAAAAAQTISSGKDITTPQITRSRASTGTGRIDGVRRLSASKIQELTASPGSLPIATLPDIMLRDLPLSASAVEKGTILSVAEKLNGVRRPSSELAEAAALFPGRNSSRPLEPARPPTGPRTLSTPPSSRRKGSGSSGSHFPPATQPLHVRRNSFNPAPRPPPLNLEGLGNVTSAAAPKGSASSGRPSAPAAAPTPTPAPAPSSVPAPPSPIPPAIPLPPMSIPTILQLELAGQRASPLYIHYSQASDLPYESSAVKFERLKNFLLLPSFLERTMNFGALACLDAWLWTFTILPMRFCGALGVLIRWWAYVVSKETRWLVGFVWEGLGRMWKRGRRGRSNSRSDSCSSASEASRSRSRARDTSSSTAHASSSGTSSALGLTANGLGPGGDDGKPSRRLENGRLASNGSTYASRPMQSAASAPTPSRSAHRGPFRHRRTKSMPSNLTSYHKADLLQGAVIIASSVALMYLDASRMYHFIRAQSAIKLYVIFNLLEVCDRLLSALGQDVLECLFSSETLSRTSAGRSKILLPFGMFLLALVYNVAHAVTLFYQVITLNVAVNSYSNALLSLLMSNQFVEIKGSVFKRFEKENSFQLTCADIVERFQLWIMLLIIGMRNVVEVGGLSVPGAGRELTDAGEGGAASAAVPLHNSSILPASFTILPNWLWSGEVLSPFLIVIGSEMIVDWIKHAYINKFNNIKPNFYSRILDILCKDYYTNAFVTPQLTRRLGLPLLPLSCLFIRASVQTYHMFLATHLPTPLPPSMTTSISLEATSPSSPAMTAALDRLDQLIRNALGRSVYGDPYAGYAASNSGTGTTGQNLSPPRHILGLWTTDDLIASLTMVVVFFLAFLVLLVLKLVLGMILLRYARGRYASMKAREQQQPAAAAAASSRRSTAASSEREAAATAGTRTGTRNEPDASSSSSGVDATAVKRLGGFGQVEVGEDRRRWLYDDDPQGLKRLRDKERRAAEQAERDRDKDFGHVTRYEMVAKRIW